MVDGQSRKPVERPAECVRDPGRFVKGQLVAALASEPVYTLVGEPQGRARGL